MNQGGVLNNLKNKKLMVVYLLMSIKEETK